MNKNIDSINRVGIVIVHFGDPKITLECLKSFIRGIHVLERNLGIKSSIIIVDNAGNFSFDKKSIERDCSNNIDICIYKPSTNLGYAGACWIIAKKYDTDIFVFSNNDIIVSDYALFYMIKALILLPNAGAIQPLVLRLINNCPTKEIDSIGLTCNPLMQGFNYSNWPIKPIREIELKDKKNKIKVIEIFGVDGMLFAIRRSVWEDIEGWDPRFFMFNEDLLLSWKLRLKGYKNYAVVNSIVYHRRGSSAEGYFVKKDPIFSSYYTSRNKILSILYLYEHKLLLKYLPLSVLWEFGKNLYLMFRNKTFKHLYYFLKALIFILRNIDYIKQERSKITRKFMCEHFIRYGYTLSLERSLKILLQNRGNLL